MLVAYLTAYMTIQLIDPEKVQHYIMVAHYTIGLISPIGQLVRGLILSLNLFSILCEGAPPVKSSNPGAFESFGGPITYLIGQSLFLFGIIIWADHRFSLGKFTRQSKLSRKDEENTRTVEREVAEEAARVVDSHDGLRVMHVDKIYKSGAYGTVHAVEDLTFGVKQGEVFALIGPNGGESILFSYSGSAD
jgi:ATP-binding cassette, subfamily A (ABC1), member 3